MSTAAHVQIGSLEALMANFVSERTYADRLILQPVGISLRIRETLARLTEGQEA
jgi:hypothetical protein